MPLITNDVLRSGCDVPHTQRSDRMIIDRVLSKENLLGHCAEESLALLAVTRSTD